MSNRACGVRSRDYFCVTCKKEYRPTHWNFSYCSDQCCEVARKKRNEEHRQAREKELKTRRQVRFQGVREGRKLPVLTPEDLKILADNPRPTDDRDCPPAGEPCPFYGCRYHLGLVVGPNNSLRYVADLESMPETCSLRQAAKGEMDFVAMERFFGASRESLRSTFIRAVRRIAKTDARLGNRLAAMAADLGNRGQSALAEAIDIMEGPDVEAVQMMATMTKRFRQLGWDKRSRTRPTGPPRRVA